MTKLFCKLEEKYNITNEEVIVGLGIVTLILIIIMIVLLVLQIRTTIKYKKFMIGNDGKSLEESLITKIEKLDKFNTDVEAINSKILKIEDILNITIQKVGIVKYDAFKEMGGKLSFSLALLSAENNGVVINSMHSREGCYTYIKEIIKGESFVLLAQEEKEAVEQAIKSRNFME